MTALPEGTGYFDLMSWQLLFVAGIYFGFAPVPKLLATGLTIASCFIPAWLHAQWQARNHRMSDSVSMRRWVNAQTEN